MWGRIKQKSTFILFQRFKQSKSNGSAKKENLFPDFSFFTPNHGLLSDVFVTGNSAKFVRMHPIRVRLSIQYKERPHRQSMLAQ